MDEASVDESEGCDVSIDVLRSAVISGVCADPTFGLNDLGIVVHTGAAEVLKDHNGDGNGVVDLDSRPAVVSAESGHGYCKKFGATCYEGADWESH